MRGRVSILHGVVASAGVARVCVFIFIVSGFEVSVSWGVIFTFVLSQRHLRVLVCFVSLVNTWSCSDVCA